MNRMKKILCCLLTVVLMGLSFGMNGMDADAAEKNSMYQIQVNRAANCVTVYQLNEQGVYVPVRSFACSTGKEFGSTPLGSFKTSDYYNWRLMVDGTYGQYAIRFYKSILFHSVPYYSQIQSSLEADQFNELGNPASLGCVRLAVSDVKWLYDNCPRGTSVIVYDDPLNPGPLGKPEQVKVDVNHPFSSWDMTDPDPANPWRAYASSIYLTNDYGDGVIYLPVGATQEQLKASVGIINFDNTVALPGTFSVAVNGNYNLNQIGVYRVWIKVINQYGVSTEQERLIAVCG